MLWTIRAKFAAVLLIGLSVVSLAALGGSVSGSNSLDRGQWTLTVAFGVILVTMLLVERIVVNPITRLTRDVVDIAANVATSVDGRLSVHGTDELATLAGTFNELLATIATKRQLEAQLTHMAHHDSLTGLPNRSRFRERLDQELPRARRGEGLAVLCLDLDHFKSVNDTLGHPVGDALLKAAADRIRGCIRETDIVSRLGGDEFAIIQLAADPQPQDLTVLADRLIDAMAQPFDVVGHQVAIGTSVGVALAPSDGLEPEQLIKAADMALYRAKADGRGLVRFFEPDMDAKMQVRRTLELDLRRAVVREEFELFYQPLVDLATEAVSGFEALIRWNHPDKGIVPPGEFIPLAEEIGLIVPIGEWVLRTACAEAVKWPNDIKVAVNLSPAQFKSKGLALAVTSALLSSKLPPKRLELEITESVLLLESDTTLATLHQLRNLGVKISMDDFGTGYSSLSYLRSFPFDKIKIDQSFVRDLSERSDSIAIVKAVSGLGRNLGMATTAEGVETIEQLGHLRDEGCTEVQGYLFSRPKPALAVLDIIEKVRNQLQPTSEETPTQDKQEQIA